MVTNRGIAQLWTLKYTCCCQIVIFRGIAQLVEQRSPKPRAEGSSPSAPAKKSSFFGTRIFLSKPQAWHIITARSAVHIISPCGAVSHHALACILLRLDDIQTFGLMIYRNKLRMIYGNKYFQKSECHHIPHIIHGK